MPAERERNRWPWEADPSKPREERGFFASIFGPAASGKEGSLGMPSYHAQASFFATAFVCGDSVFDFHLENDGVLLNFDPRQTAQKSVQLATITAGSTSSSPIEVWKKGQIWLSSRSKTVARVYTWPNDSP